MNKTAIKELALAHGFKLKAQEDGSVDLNPYVYEFAEKLMAVAAAELTEEVAKLKYELTLSTDQNDLLLDEFVRVKLLTKNTEIHQLCERAHVRMRQRVSVIDRNFKQAEEIKELKAQVEHLQSIADAFIENVEEVTELLSASGDAPNIVLLVNALNQIADDIETSPFDIESKRRLLLKTFIAGCDVGHKYGDNPFERDRQFDYFMFDLKQEAGV